MKGKIMWLSPPVIFEKALSFMSVWASYMRDYGWELVDDPDSADLLFFGSDSMLEPHLTIMDKPKIGYFWGFLHERLRDPEFREFAEYKMRMFKKCDVTLVPSLVTYYQACDLGIEAELCLPGIDTKLYDSVPDQKRTDQVIYLSRFAECKLLDVLIKAVSLIKPQPTLLIAGAGDKQPYVELASALGVKMTIGELTEEEKAVELKRSAVLVHPTIYGCYSTPPFEALYCGTPIIVSDIPVHHWLFRDTAIYTANEPMLAEAIMKVLDNPQKALRRAERGRDLTKKIFTLDLACKRLEEYILRVLKEHK